MCPCNILDTMLSSYDRVLIEMQFICKKCFDKNLNPVYLKND